jgi:hypothetical protein
MLPSMDAQHMTPETPGATYDIISNWLDLSASIWAPFPSLDAEGHEASRRHLSGAGQASVGPRPARRLN